MPSRQKAIGDARLAAQTLHAQLQTDFSQPIDIFSIVQQLEIWLTTRPLGGLYGFYLKQDDAVGIVLNEGHPEYLQRYTCAHELGHHTLDHASHLDEHDQIERGAPNGAWEELAAQAFAGAFLVPLQALNQVQRRLDIPRDRAVSAAEAYLISRELDVSFSAAVWQLVTHDRLDPYAARQYVNQGAAAAKSTLRPGPPPTGDNRAGLAILGPTQNGLSLQCRTGDELRIRLPENASTGHIWQLLGHRASSPRGPAWDGGNRLTNVPDGDPSMPGEPGTSVRLLDDRHLEPTGSDAEVGSPGIRELVFLAQESGAQDVQLRFGRPWEPEPEGHYASHVRVDPLHSVIGFAEIQRSKHMARSLGA